VSVLLGLVDAGDVDAMRVAVAAGVVSVSELRNVVLWEDRGDLVGVLGEVLEGGLVDVLVGGCSVGAFRVVDACLGLGADASGVVRGGSSALAAAVSLRWVWGVRRLLRAGADPSSVVVRGWRFVGWRLWRLRWVWWLCAFVWLRLRVVGWFRGVLR
jgi:hypothetical protein